MDMIGLLNNAESFLPPEPLNLHQVAFVLVGLLAKSRRMLTDGCHCFGQPRTSIPSICRGILQNRCKLSPVLKSHSNPKK